MGQAIMAFDASVTQRCILVAAEGKNRLIHPFGVKHLEPHEKVEVGNG